ncbi:DUF155-domain-containing protein [Cryptosporidium felis]|nr:DUF155-domain-containing protein [Cryptosporidium felis]
MLEIEENSVEKTTSRDSNNLDSSKFMKRSVLNEQPSDRNFIVNRYERRNGRSLKTRNAKLGSELPKYIDGNYKTALQDGEDSMLQDPDLIESFNVIRGFCLCEGYNLESLHSALNKHNYCHWYVDKEKTIIVFDLNPYFDKVKITWATQGRTGRVLFPAGIYPPVKKMYKKLGKNCEIEENSKIGSIEKGPIYFLGTEGNSNENHGNEPLIRKKEYINDPEDKSIKYYSSDRISSPRFDEQYTLNYEFQPFSSPRLEEIYKEDILERGEDLSNDENYWKRLENPIFVFRNGLIVAWGNEEVTSSSVTHLDSPKYSDERLDDVLTFLSLYSIGSFVGKFSKNSQYYTMLFKYGNYKISRLYKSNRKMISDIVTLKTRSAEEKLAASLAIGQSIRLSLFESFIGDCVDSIKYLPLKLAQVGASSVIEEEFSVRVPQIRKRFSELYSYQISVNLVEDFLDIPEIFWHNYRFHSVWRNLQEYLEISERLQVLNKRIIMMQELLKVITEEYQTNQANRLTWIVIILLALHCIAFILNHILLNRS